MNSSTTLAALVAHYRRLTRGKPTPDAELLRRFADQREAAAFEELVERYAPLVWGVCWRILHRETNCEDAFQATFLSLVRQAGCIDPTRPLGAWLHTVAARTAAKAQARLRRQPTQTTIPEQTTCGDIADELGNRELFRVVDEEIARLPALLREPFVLCCLEGRTRDEAATALGCSVAAIKSRLERARALLRRSLERRGFGLPAAFLVLGLTGGPVRASLRAKTLQCVLGSAPSAVAALVPAAGMSLASKWTLTAMTFVLVGVLSFGAYHAMQAEPPQEAPAQAKDIAPKTPPSPAGAKSQPRLDRFGDPLPPGVIRRFGTLRFRRRNIVDLAFTPNGKQLIAGDGCSPLAVFDALTGRKLREVGKKSTGANSLTGFALSPDGKRVACCGSDVFVWDFETGRLIRQLDYGFCKEAAFSPDGTRLAVAIKETSRGAITGVAIVEAATGKQVARWTILTKEELGRFWFNGIAFSADGKFLAGCFSEHREEKKPAVQRAISTQVWLFDASTGKRVRTFGASGVPVVCFAFQPGTGRLATFDKDGILCFWDVATGNEVKHFPAAKGKENNDFGVLRFSADGRRCAVLTDRKKYLTVLDTKDGRVIRRIEGKEGRMRHPIALSADGKTVAAARTYEEPCVQVWDVSSGTERLADAGHRAEPTALSLSSDGRILISRDEQGQEIHWDLRTGKGEARSNVAREEIGQFTWSLDHSQKTLLGPRWRLIYKNQRPPMIEVGSLDGAKLIRKMELHTRLLPTVAFSPDGGQLAIAPHHINGVNSTVMLWDLQREEKPRTLPGSPDYCWELLFSHNGKRLIGRSGRIRGNNNCTGAVWIWDTAQARLIRTLPAKGIPGHLLLTADDRLLLASISWKEATICAWDMETGKELALLKAPSQKPQPQPNNDRIQTAITGIALSANERLLAVISAWDDGSLVSIWETGSWKLVRSFAPLSPRNDVKAMVFSRDGRSLFVANGDSTILEWGLSDRFGRKRQTLNKDRLNVLWQSLADAPDEAYPAVWELLDHPAESVPFLIGKVAPIKPVEEKRLRQMLAQLDSESFAEREEASRQLVTLGEQIVPMLRLALKERLSLEAKKRIEGVIESLTRDPTSEQLRLLRALAVLEWNGRPEAIEHLRRLAGGAASASLTQAAKAALQRRRR